MPCRRLDHHGDHFRRTPRGTGFVGRRARGTAAAPTAVQNGDALAVFTGRGYGATGFSAGRLGRSSSFERCRKLDRHGTRHEQSTSRTTQIGSTTSVNQMTLDPSGNLGIGTTTPSAAVEVVRDRR